MKQTLIIKLGLGCYLIFCLQPNAFADDTHYQDFLVGTRAVGVGGAFAGLSNDASGLWINPGGLSFTKWSDVNIATSFYGFDYQKLDTGSNEITQEKDPLSINFFDDIRVVPVTFGGVLGIAGQKKDLTYTHSLAFLIAFPSYSDMEQELDRFSSDPAKALDVTSFYRHQIRDWTAVAGIGYCWRVKEWLGLGIGLFYIHRYLHREDLTNHRFIRLNSSIPEFFWTQTRLRHTSGTILFNLGARFDLNEEWSLGVSFRPPAIPVRARTSYEIFAGGAQLDDNGQLISVAEHDRYEMEDKYTLLPFHLRLGFAWEPPQMFCLTFDVSVSTPISYDIFDGNIDLKVPLPMPYHITRNAVVNVNTGFEYLIIKQLSVAIGAFTNLTSAPPIPPQPRSEMLPYIQQFGGTVALGYFGEHSLIRLGFSGSYGTGSDVVRDDEGSEDSVPHYKRITVNRFMLHVYVATTFRY